MKLPDFKIRCSAIGQIMTNSRKKGELSKTAQSYIDTWIKEQIYNRRKVVTTKYMEKGNIVEDRSIAFAGRVLNADITKNQQRYENELLIGTPDVITDDYVFDLKNSWDCFTFPLFKSDVPNTDYLYQAQGYMALTGLHHYKLIYTLMDTPDSLIENEFKFSSQLDFDTFAADYRYNKIDDAYRIRIFEIERDDEVIAAIYERVKECREYINKLILPYSCYLLSNENTKSN
jgi:hypothetical protein